MSKLSEVRLDSLLMSVALDVQSLHVTHKNGIPWHEARRPFIVHAHRAWSSMPLGSQRVLARCACGSFSENGGRTWTLTDRKMRYRYNPFGK
jgi:hypothetical protein